MSTTSAYGWNIPDNTDLVKDGALAIRTLGNAIDTSMNTALGTKKSGLVLLNTTSFTSVASQSVNDVFSATYDNYRLVFAGTYPSGANTELRLRMRVSGADNTAASYDYSIFRMNYTNTTSAFGAQNVTSFEQLANMSTSTGFSVDTVIFNPFLARNTDMTSLATGESPGRVISGCTHKVASSFTGFTIYTANAANITGKVSVYGFNL
jgi:hypothetical protein